jgi:hypothetical protein
MAPEGKTASKTERGRDPLIAYFAHSKEESTYWGALVLVTPEGDPMDFVYTEPVTLNSFMRRLLGPRADAYVVDRVLIKPLVEHLSEPISLVCFDAAVVLQRRLDLKVPLAVIAPPDAPHREGAWSPEALDGAGALTCWVTPESRQDALKLVREAMSSMAPFGLLEPFRQLRDAMAELKREKA